MRILAFHHAVFSFVVGFYNPRRNGRFPWFRRPSTPHAEVSTGIESGIRADQTRNSVYGASCRSEVLAKGPFTMNATVVVDAADGRQASEHDDQISFVGAQLVRKVQTACEIPPFGSGTPRTPTSHSRSFVHRRLDPWLQTAFARAFFCPTMTTRRLPRVTAV